MARRSPDGPEIDLDSIYRALAHPIRRVFIDRLVEASRSVGELANPHDVSILRDVTTHDWGGSDFALEDAEGNPPQIVEDDDA